MVCMMAQSLLLSLPEELLIDIFEIAGGIQPHPWRRRVTTYTLDTDFQGPRHLKTLLALQLTCKTICPTVTPLIWRSVVLHLCPGRVAFVKRRRTYLPSKTMDLIASQPHRAVYVRILAVHVEVCPGSPIGTEVLLQKEVHRYFERLLTTLPSLRALYTSDAAWLRSTACATLSQLPYFRHLCIGGGELPHITDTGSRLKDVGLPKLESLSISSTQTYWNFQRFPRLRSLTLRWGTVRKTLEKALEVANEAIRLDSAGGDPVAASIAYNQALTLVGEVRDIEPGNNVSHAGVTQLGTICESYARRRDGLRAIHGITAVPYGGRRDRHVPDPIVACVMSYPWRTLQNLAIDGRHVLSLVLDDIYTHKSSVRTIPLKSLKIKATFDREQLQYLLSGFAGTNLIEIALSFVAALRASDLLLIVNAFPTLVDLTLYTSRRRECWTDDLEDYVSVLSGLNYLRKLDWNIAHPGTMPRNDAIQLLGTRLPLLEVWYTDVAHSCRDTFIIRRNQEGQYVDFEVSLTEYRYYPGRWALQHTAQEAGH